MKFVTPVYFSQVTYFNIFLNSSFDSSNEENIYSCNYIVINIYSNNSKVRWSREKEYICI